MTNSMLSGVIASILVSYVAATCFTCPQTIPDTTDAGVCASNSLGNFTVNAGEIANWNCNHPLDRKCLYEIHSALSGILNLRNISLSAYSIISSEPCPARPNTCGPISCGLSGPTVCARSISKVGLGYITAVFSNICQLKYYNCRNPTKELAEISTTNNPYCKSWGL